MAKVFGAQTGCDALLRCKSRHEAALIADKIIGPFLGRNQRS
jgi:hypothetical protein